MTKMYALHNFWSGFEWKAYDVNTVPNVIPDEFITYEVASDEFGNVINRNANLWSRSTSWESITQKEEEISRYIGRGGRIVPYDGGAFWIKKGTPWAQRMDEPEDDMMRRILLIYEIEFIE